MRQRTAPSLADQVMERHVNGPSEDESFIDPPVRLFLSTGCSLLNLALSDRVDGGWPCGRIVNPIGDSDTGKSILAMHALAEACKNPAFDDHRLIYMDMESSLTCHKLFGRKVNDRMELKSPCQEKNPAPETIEALHYHLLNLFEEDKPFVCVVDSFDALPSQQELDETKKAKKAFDKDEDSSGSYQASKQKYSKKMFREIKGTISNTDSLLIVVSQTIANLSRTAMFNPKAVAGGNALEFFCRIRFWLSKLTELKVRDRPIGRNMKCKVTKNHVTGKKRELKLWVMDNIGFDDIRSSIDFLCDNSVWPKVGGWVEPRGLHDGRKFQIADLIRQIEDNNEEEELAQLLQQTWNDIEESLKQQRKVRYE